MNVISGRRLTASEMKYPERWAHFRRKMETGQPFQLMDGGEVIIPVSGNESLLRALDSQDRAGYTEAFRRGVGAFRGGEPVTLHSAGELHKSADFGGKSSGHGLRRQDAQIASLAGDLRRIGDGGPVPVFLGDRVVEVVGIVEAGKGEKADALLLGGDGEVVGRLSLKYADEPYEMQQWGGLSAWRGEPEVLRFVDEIRGMCPLQGAIKVPVDSREIALGSLYGVGSTHVDVILASKYCGFKLRSDGSWELVGRRWYHPDLPPIGSGWEPVMLARPSPSRRDLGVGGVRFGVFPAGYRPSVKNRIGYAATGILTDTVPQGAPEVGLGGSQAQIQA